jgi:phosphatidylglycerophosphatase C
MTKNLALFDFDGTITRKDTFPLFLLSCHKSLFIYLLLFTLSPLIVLQKLGWIREGMVKEMVLKLLFKHMPIEKFAGLGKDFAMRIIPSLTRTSALDRIDWHQKNGDKIFIVTASISHWVAPWADTLGIQVVGSEVELKDGKLTGRLSGENCIKKEKVARIKKIIDLNDFEEIYAYGDSAGDREMLQIASKPHFRYFKD